MLLTIGRMLHHYLDVGGFSLAAESCKQQTWGGKTNVVRDLYSRVHNPNHWAWRSEPTCCTCLRSGSLLVLFVWSEWRLFMVSRRPDKGILRPKGVSHHRDFRTSFLNSPATLVNFAATHEMKDSLRRAPVYVHP